MQGCRLRIAIRLQQGDFIANQGLHSAELSSLETAHEACPYIPWLYKKFDSMYHGRKYIFISWSITALMSAASIE